MDTAWLHRNLTLWEALLEVARRYPHRVALVAGEARLTYRQVVNRAQALAQAWQARGVRKGDRLAMLLWSEAAFVHGFFAAASIGAVVAPLPPRIRKHRLEQYLRDLAPVGLVSAADAQVEGGRETLEHLPGAIPGLSWIMIMDPEDEAGEPALAIEDGLKTLPAEEVAPQDALAVLYTSGTTGEPKGAVHSHRSLISPVVASLRLREMWLQRIPSPRLLRRWVRALAHYGMRLLRAAGRQQVLLSLMAMHTISGLEAMLQALVFGDRLVLLRRFHPVRALELAMRERATVLIAPPVAYVAMLRSQEAAGNPIPSLLICATGAAPCPPELAREIQARFGCAVHIGFGLTEVGGGIAATGLDDAPRVQAETVGQPMPGIEVRIVDEDNRPLPPGEVGELACRSPGLMIGYLGGEGIEDDRRDAEGWYYTGDLAVMDARGFLRILGRMSDRIIRGGQNIYPQRIEDHLAQLPGIREAAVVGVPDALLGETIWAFVIPEEGAAPGRSEILAHCRQGLEAHEVPDQVRVVEDWPRAESGKAQKYRLRQIATQERADDR